MAFSGILCPVKANTFNDQHVPKNKFFRHVFHQGCLKKMTTNPQITPEL